MDRKTYVNIMGMILGTTLTGLILLPAAIVMLPLVMINPRILDRPYNSATSRFFQHGTRIMMRAMH